MTITVRENKAKNGIEIYFSEKPTQEVINNLKSKFWRYSGYNKCWYNRMTSYTKEFAEGIKNNYDSNTTSEINVPLVEEKKTINEYGIDIGDIYYTSWGYDMTIVEFFQVVGVTPKRAKVKKIAKEGCNGFSGYVTPIKDRFVEDAVYTSGINCSYNDNTPFLTNCDGNNHPGYAYIGNPVYFNTLD